MKAESKKYLLGLICAGLVLLVLTAFEPVRHNDFVDYDDTVYVVNNPHIQSGLTTQSIIWAFSSDFAANWHPLTWLSHMLDIEFFGLNPVWHHAHSLILHVFSVVLLFLILRTMTGNIWCSAFTAAVVGLHPLRVESVAWAAERKDVLCAMFWMLTIQAYIHYARQGGWLRYISTLLCLALALMAKPMAVTLPGVLLLLDIWPLNRMNQEPAPKRAGMGKSDRNTATKSGGLCRPLSFTQIMMEKIPFFILVLISCMITYRVQQKWGAVNATQLTWYLKLTNIPISYVRYIFKTLWPVDLAVLYPFPQNGWPFWQVAGALVLLIGLSALAVYNIKRRPYLLVGWSWYVITLIPVIGLIQVGNQSIADRYSYLPSIGLCIMLTWSLADAAQAWRYRNLAYSILGGISIIAIMALSRTQIVHWKDTYSLYQYTVSVTQDNYIIYNNLASVSLREGKLDKASEYVEKALAICPGFCLANINKAILLKDKKQHEKALVYINEVMGYAPDQWQVYMTRGEILEAMGRLDEALQSYKKAIEINNIEFLPFYNTGLILAKQASLQEAVYYFEQAIDRNPCGVNIYRDLGQARQFLNQWDEAISIYQKALTIKSDDHTVLYRLGYCFEKQGNYSRAIDYYRQVLQLQPEFLPAINQLALILATASDSGIRDPSEAIKLSKKGCEITSFKDYRMLNALAAAYAAANQFQEAVDAIQKAIELARADNDMDLVSQLTDKLELYRGRRTSLESEK